MLDLLSRWQPTLIAIASAGEHGDDDRDDGAHDLNHLHRVWANARALIAISATTGATAATAAANTATVTAADHATAADALVVMAACYLHDLVNLPKNHPERARASCLSAARARAALAAAHFPPDRLEGVCHAIEAHSFSAALPACTLEARLVQDADRLDSLGAIGLARLFYTAGQMHSALAHGADPLAQQRPLDDRAYALDHIVVKLARLPSMMQTAAGRALAEQRLARLLAFREDFALEWGAASAPANTA